MCYFKIELFLPIQDTFWWFFLEKFQVSICSICILSSSEVEHVTELEFKSHASWNELQCNHIWQLIMTVNGQTMVTVWLLSLLIASTSQIKILYHSGCTYISQNTLTVPSVHPETCLKEVHSFIVFHWELYFKCHTCLLVFSD